MARSTRIKPVERSAARTFDIVTCGEGAAVIDALTGHQITDTLVPFEAREVADKLNVAATYGVRRLTQALAMI